MKEQIKIDIDSLTDEELLMILKHRKKKQQNIWDTVKKEPIFWLKDIRRAFIREVMRFLTMYLLIIYGLSDIIKK